MWKAPLYRHKSTRTSLFYLRPRPSSERTARDSSTEGESRKKKENAQVTPIWNSAGRFDSFHFYCRCFWDCYLDSGRIWCSYMGLYGGLCNSCFEHRDLQNYEEQGLESIIKRPPSFPEGPLFRFINLMPFGHLISEIKLLSALRLLACLLLPHL